MRRENSTSLYSKLSAGGLALGCHQKLKPVFVRDGGEKVEALS